MKTSSPTRRELLRLAAAGAAGVVACATGAAFAAKDAVTAPDASPSLIDTHQHLWDRKRFRLPWLDKAGEVLNRDYSMADYLKAAEGLNVTRAVYMEVAVTPEQRPAEAEYVIDLCRRGGTPIAAAVVGGSPGAEDFAAYITRFKDSPYVKGVRESFRQGCSADPKFLKGVRLLGELGMSFDLLHGPDLMAEAASVAKACPDTHFVLDHCGNADARDFRPAADAAAAQRRRRWEEGLAALAERPNVACKISGVLEAAAPDKLTADDVARVVNPCLDRFGPDRVVFAGNWPVCNRGGTFREWVEILHKVTRGRTPADLRKLFSGNALRWYRLG